MRGGGALSTEFCRSTRDRLVLGQMREGSDTSARHQHALVLRILHLDPKYVVISSRDNVILLEAMG